MHIFWPPEYHGMSGKDRYKISEVFNMCNNGMGNCCWWIIILIVLFSCCGGGNSLWGGNNGCGCGCDNNCGCC